MVQVFVALQVPYSQVSDVGDRVVLWAGLMYGLADDDSSTLADYQAKLWLFTAGVPVVACYWDRT